MSVCRCRKIIRSRSPSQCVKDFASGPVDAAVGVVQMKLGGHYRSDTNLTLLTAVAAGRHFHSWSHGFGLDTSSDF